jgi:POT family proton-dependent oligopeptide transporter
MFYSYQKVLLVKLLELYSFYSLRSVLVLIFVVCLGFSDLTAFLVYTNFVVGGDIISILGAYFGDKLLTRRISWLIGSVISIFGYSYSYFHYNGTDIPFGLIFAGMGLGLCRCNSNVIINDYIQQEISKDQRHDHNGLFHVVTIVALFLGFLVNGFIVKYSKPEYVFLLSGLSVFLGLILFLYLEWRQIITDLQERARLSFKKILYVCLLLVAAFLFGEAIQSLKDSIQVLILVCVVFAIIFLARLSLKYHPRDKQSVLSLLLYVPFYLIYLSFEKQLDMSFSLFLFRNVNKTIFGYTLPPSAITCMFSVVILAISFFFYKKSLYSSLKHHNTLILGMMCASFYFFLNYIGCFLSRDGIVAIYFPLLSLMFLGIADVIIVPRMYSLCRNVPDQIKSTASSLMMLSHGSGFYIAGKLAKFVAIDSKNASIFQSLQTYQTGFLSLFFTSILVLGAIFIISKFHIGTLLNRK